MKKFFILLPIVLLFSVLSCSTSDSSSSPVSNGGTEPETPEEHVPYLARYKYTAVKGEHLIVNHLACVGYCYATEGGEFAVPDKLNMHAVFVSKDTSVTPNKDEYYMTADCGYYIDEENAVLIPNGKFYTHIDPKTDCWIE